MKKTLNSMWFFVLVLLVFSMGVSAAIFFLYMRSII